MALTSVTSEERGEKGRDRIEQEEVEVGVEPVRLV